MLLRIVGLKECGLGTHSLGLDWPLTEVGTVLEQKICSSPHHLIIRACLPGPETENTHTHTHTHTPSHPQEGNIMDLYEAIVISDMTHINAKKSNQWNHSPLTLSWATHHSASNPQSPLTQKVLIPLTPHFRKISTLLHHHLSQKGTNKRKYKPKET